MALQKSVNQSQALGFNGKIAQGTHSYFNTIGAVAGSDIEIGSFVQTKDGVVTQATGKAITGKILGVAVFENFQDGASDSAVVAKGNNVTICNAGSVYLTTDQKATQGQAVVLKTDDGALSFVDEIDTATHTFTGFVVAQGNSEAKAGVIVITTAGATLAKYKAVVNS